MYIENCGNTYQNYYLGQVRPQVCSERNTNTNYHNISMKGKGLPTKNSGIKDFFNKIFSKIFDSLPEKTINDGNVQKRERINNIISNPVWNRVIMGVTALAIQPFIDLANKKVDEDTRKVSAIRTLSKIIVGMSVGCLVRGSCYKLTKMMTDVNGTKKYSKWLLPKDTVIDPKKIESHTNAVSTLAGMGVMVFTNFLLDAPLTTQMSNRLNRNNFKRLEEKNGRS